MKRFIYILFICICVTACNKCKKDKKPESKIDYGQYKPPINLADYCFFKQGSYWVYQDSISGAIDCTYVTSAYVTTYTVDANAGKDYMGVFHYYNMFTKDGVGDERQFEVYDEDAAESAKCCNGRYFCEAHWNRPPKTDSNGNITSGIYYGSYTFMFNDFNNGTTGGSSDADECWSRGITPQLTIFNITYSEVKIFENSKNIYDNNWNVHSYKFKNYFVKNIGIVKRIDIDSNRTWLLKNHYVSQ